MLSQDEISDIVRDFKALAVEIENRHRLAGEISEGDRQGLMAMRQEDIADARIEAARGDFKRSDLAVEVMIGRRHLRLNEVERRQLGQALLIAGIEAMGVSHAQLTGQLLAIAAEPSPLPPAHGPRQAPPAPQHIEAHGNPADVSGRTPLLSVASRDFLEHQRTNKIWDQQTLRQAEKTFELATEIVGDHRLETFARAEGNRIKSTLQELPADYGKAAIFRGKPALEILVIDKSRQPAAERLALRTVKRHLSVLSALWKWKAREGAQLTNPFQGFSFPSAKRANEQREMWNTEDLRALFSSPVWSGCKSEMRRSESGTLIIRDEKFWLPLIALFSGMRQEEICQLQLDDIRRVDGIWVFDINARPPRKLKNKNAVRKVPVHPELQSLGLMNFVAEQRKLGQTSLFPDLSPGGADSRLGHSYSKWFARYRQAIGIYRRGLDFHSLRHTATTLLYRAGIAREVIDELTGHVTPGETARYSHGQTMEQLRGAISSIEPAIGLSHLKV